MQQSSDSRRGILVPSNGSCLYLTELPASMCPLFALKKQYVLNTVPKLLLHAITSRVSNLQPHSCIHVSCDFFRLVQADYLAKTGKFGWHKAYSSRTTYDTN